MNDDVARRGVSGALGSALLLADAESLFAVDGSRVRAGRLRLLALAVEIGVLLRLHLRGVRGRQRLLAVRPQRAAAVRVVVAVLRLVEEVERFDLELRALLLFEL